MSSDIAMPNMPTGSFATSGSAATERPLNPGSSAEPSSTGPRPQRTSSAATGTIAPSDATRRVAEVITIDTEKRNNNIGTFELMRSVVGKNEDKAWPKSGTDSLASDGNVDAAHRGQISTKNRTWVGVAYGFSAEPSSVINSAGKEVQFRQADPYRSAVYYVRQPNELTAKITNTASSSETPSSVETHTAFSRHITDITDARVGKDGNVEVRVSAKDETLSKGGQLDTKAYPNGLAGQWVSLDLLVAVHSRLDADIYPKK
jgi:hypothetical protein